MGASKSLGKLTRGQSTKFKIDEPTSMTEARTKKKLEAEGSVSDILGDSISEVHVTNNPTISADSFVFDDNC